jgi:hypothetical protein
MTPNLYLKIYFVILILIPILVFSNQNEPLLVLAPQYKQLLKEDSENQLYVELKFPYVETDWLNTANEKHLTRYPIDARTQASEICSFLLKTVSTSLPAYSKTIKSKQTIKGILINNAQNNDVALVSDTTEIYSSIVCNNASPSDYVGSLLHTEYPLFSIKTISRKLVLQNIIELEKESITESITEKKNYNKKLLTKNKFKKISPNISHQEILKKLNIAKVGNLWFNQNNNVRLLLNPDKLIQVSEFSKNKKIVVYLDRSSSTNAISKNLEESYSFIKNYYSTQNIVVEKKRMPYDDAMEGAWQDALDKGVLHVYVLSDGHWEEWCSDYNCLTDLRHTQLKIYDQESNLKKENDTYRYASKADKIIDTLSGDRQIQQGKIKNLENQLANSKNDFNRQLNVFYKKYTELRNLQINSQKKITHFTYVVSKGKSKKMMNEIFRKYIAPYFLLDSEFHQV